MVTEMTRVPAMKLARILNLGKSVREDTTMREAKLHAAETDMHQEAVSWVYPPASITNGTSMKKFR